MSKEAMKLAYEALKYMDGYYISLPQQGMQAIKALEEALAKQEQGEPVALVTGVYGGRFTYAPFKESLILPVGIALYSSPQQRTWVGLTPEEVKEISLANRPYVVDMVVALEARLKQKNGYAEENT